MNLSSASLPCASTDASALTNSDSTLGLKDLLLLQLASFLVSSSDSLNGKRQLFPQEGESLKELSIDSVSGYKKFKGNDDNSTVVKPKNEVPIRKINSKFNQLGEKIQVNPKNIIVLDEEEDCLILDEASFKAHKGSSSRPNPVFFDDYLDSFHNLSDQLSFITDNQKVKLPSAKQPEIIVLDDDDEDQLTCDSTPLIKQDSLISDTESVQPLRQISEKLIETFEDEKKEVPISNILIQCAKIPSFELSVIGQKQRKVRQVKSVWRPSDFKAKAFESWVEQIEKAVGIQITNQEKVLKTMKNFDVNLEIALEKIRRSKAHYKDYFRVKKFHKN